jgi:selT/selW/selH-like putative selenoprotein
LRSSGGVFEVSVDGEQIFSKRKTGRFPDEETEILAPLRSRLSKGSQVL